MRTLIFLAMFVCYQIPFAYADTVEKAHNPPVIMTLPHQQQPDWIDKQHQNTRKILHQTAQFLNNWFGTPDPNTPAKASLRVIVDTNWQETDGVTNDIKVRGKVKLPTLEKNLSVVFGDERLDKTANQSTHDTLPNDGYHQDNELVHSSLAVRWSDLNQKLPFDTDFDMGIRSRGNIFAQLKASKNWQLAEKTNLYTEQTYRYSTRNKNEFISHWEIHHQQDSNSHISTPTNFYYQHNHHDIKWDTSLLHTHHYTNQKKLSYGLYADGFINDNNVTTNRNGAIFSWRQPIWRKWLFVQNDIAYLNNQQHNRKHEFSGLVRLEAIF